MYVLEGFTAAVGGAPTAADNSDVASAVKAEEAPSSAVDHQRDATDIGGSESSDPVSDEDSIVYSEEVSGSPAGDGGEVRGEVSGKDDGASHPAGSEGTPVGVGEVVASDKVARNEGSECRTDGLE